jgi:hypothetical protein
MSGLKIKVEFAVGTSVEEAAGEMVRLSRRLDVTVTGKFNDSPIHAYPSDTVEKVIRYWEDARCENGR